MLQSSSGQTAPESVVLRLRLIGQMEAWTLSTESVLPPGRKTRALLAIVALSAPRPVLRSRLAEMLWSRRPEEQARASLRQEIHRLLDALSCVGTEVLSVTRDHLALRPGLTWVDVEEVLRATAQHPAALALLDRELLEELDGIDPAFDTWLMAERERLRDRARGLAEDLLRDQADPDATVPAAQRLLSIDRAHEGAWRALMRAYAARGEHGMAIQSYERCRAALADLLDAVPSPETQRLMAEIRSGKETASPPASVAPPPLAPEPRPEPAPRPPRNGGTSVGVLPLVVVGEAAGIAHLADGLAEEITAALARSRGLALVSSAALARFAAETRDETAIHRAFALDFLLDGTIRHASDRLRISLRLLDLRAGNQVVWAQHFDRRDGDLLTLQDEVAALAAAQVDPEILQVESRRVAARPAPDPGAYELTLRAMPLITRFDRAQFLQAGELLARAVAMEPDYAPAHALYAYWHIFLIRQWWAKDVASARHEAGRLAERAVMLDPQDSRALTIAGHVRAALYRRPREALTLHERSLALNPSQTMAWGLSGLTYVGLGELDEAERRLQRSRALAPHDPQSFLYESGLAITHLLRHDHEAAAAMSRDVACVAPAYLGALIVNLAALGHLGRGDEAAEVRQRLLAAAPSFNIATARGHGLLVRDQDRKTLSDGLRLAGVPEDAARQHELS